MPLTKPSAYGFQLSDRENPACRNPGPPRATIKLVDIAKVGGIKEVDRSLGKETTTMSGGEFFGGFGGPGSGGPGFGGPGFGGPGFGGWGGPGSGGGWARSRRPWWTRWPWFRSRRSPWSQASGVRRPRRCCSTGRLTPRRSYSGCPRRPTARSPLRRTWQSLPLGCSPAAAW